jgi:hypothetical protein
MEHEEVVTVTEVGKPGTQAALAADAKAGDTNIKVSNLANISPGDKIRLDIDSGGHGVETVTVAKVGTRATFNPGSGRQGDTGTGLDLAEPLKFNHSANIPFSARGTGIIFQPATAFAHSSNEPIQPLGTGITLESPLSNDHPIHAVVRDAAVTTAGYQGAAKPDQWFGGPALANAGSMVLRDGAGLVVDSLNYGGVIDPWAAEGYQATAGARQGGCSVPAPAPGGRGGRSGVSGVNRSAGRVVDGADSDSNCQDFSVQNATTLPLAAGAGENNIKVAGVAGFTAGQTIVLDAGENQETAVIAAIGTAGGTTVSGATEAGATVIPVASTQGFSAGQTITIDSDGNRETAVVASITVPGRGGRGGRGGVGAGGGPAGISITVSAPLAKAHAERAPVSGSGITLTAALAKAHDTGAAVAGGVPSRAHPTSTRETAMARVDAAMTGI